MWLLDPFCSLYWVYSLNRVWIKSKIWNGSWSLFIKSSLSLNEGSLNRVLVVIFKIQKLDQGLTSKQNWPIANIECDKLNRNDAHCAPIYSKLPICHCLMVGGGGEEKMWRRLLYSGSWYHNVLCKFYNSQNH